MIFKFDKNFFFFLFIINRNISISAESVYLLMRLIV